MQQRFVRRDMVATASRTEQMKGLGQNRGNDKQWKTWVETQQGQQPCLLTPTSMKTLPSSSGSNCEWCGFFILANKCLLLIGCERRERVVPEIRFVWGQRCCAWIGECSGLESQWGTAVIVAIESVLMPFPSPSRFERSDDCSRKVCQRASCATYRQDPYTLLHERLSTDPTRSWTMQRHWDDLKPIAQQELTLSIFHTVRSLIRLVFITSHLVYYSTMTSLAL